ncbi:MAG TPA: LuxR C-terminal-related transcriptional regulator [Nitrobacter sp.]|nr:LuxR C-terminal-related transcriptional regulator [Nitrobacter sp.]
MTSRQDALLDLIYGAILDPQRWPNVLIKVADHVGAVGGLLTHISPERDKSMTVIGRLSEERTAIYRSHYAWNPWAVAMQRAPFGKPVSANTLLEPGAIFKTGFYADVLAPQGIVDTLNISHRAMAGERGVGGIGFSMSRRGAEKISENMRRLQRLAPHLGRALEGTLHLRHIADSARQLEGVLQLMPNPALLISARGRITFANAAAEMLLQTGDGLVIDNGGGLQFTAALPAEAAALSKMLAQALAVAAGTGDVLGEPLRLTRPSGAPPLLVLPVPLPPPAFELWNLLEPARVLVLIIDPAAQWRGKASTIQAAFGLTLAESRVAVLIASGLTGPQAARALGISLTTVKTHLKRCFDKIGIHSQVALARLLATLPADRAGGWS